MPKKKLQGYNLDDLPLVGIEFIQKKEAIAELDSQCKQLRIPLEAALKEKGRLDAKGSRLLVLPHSDVEVHLNHTRRISTVLKADALEVLKAEGLTECIKQVPVVDDEKISQLYDMGKISKELLERLYEPKESFAFSAKLVNKFHET